MTLLKSYKITNNTKRGESMEAKIFIVEKDGVEYLRTTERRWYYKYLFETLSLTNYEVEIVVDTEKKTETLKLTKFKKCD